MFDSNFMRTDNASSSTELTLLIGDLTSGLTEGKNALSILQNNYPEVYDSLNYLDAIMKCNSYGQDNGYEIFSDGWYLPAVAELQIIDANLDVINNSLLKIGTKAFTSVELNVLSCNQNLNSTLQMNIYNFSTHGMSSHSKTSNNIGCTAFREFR